MALRDVILETASRRQAFRTADVTRALRGRASRQHVSATINRLVREGRLIKGGSTRGAFYALPQHSSALGVAVRKRLLNESLREEEVLDGLRRRAPFLGQLRQNVAGILAYAFCEMLNNAIEHSESRAVEVEINRAGGVLAFVVNDFGVGAFRNVMRQRNLNSELEAIQDLLKGKTTTAPAAHSGEGIFFTSKVADVFSLESFNYTLRVDNVVDDAFVGERRPSKRGTRVTFEIAERSARRLDDVFKKYVTDLEEPAFDRSEIQVRLYTHRTIYISRSQARRLLAGLEKFRAVTLDFSGVRTVGQAFVDEVFRVFPGQHPETAITPVNMNDAVRFMADRARSW